MFLLVISVLILYITYLFGKYLLTYDPLSKFPSPRGLPVIGNAFQVDNSRPHHSMLKWAKELGAAYIFRAFGKPHLVVNSKEGLHEILVERGDDYGGRPKMYRADYAFENCQCVAFQSVSPEWKVLRMEAHRSVKQYGDGLKNLEKITLDAISDMLDRFEERKGEEFDPRLEFYETFTHIVFMLIIGETIPRNDPLLKDVIIFERGYCDGFTGAGDGMLLDMFPWLRFFGNKSYNILKKAKEARERVWGTYLPKLKESYVPGKERGIFDALYETQLRQIKEKSPVIITDKALEMALTDIVNGGTATTTATIYAFLNILLHNPTVQTQMFEEISSYLGDRQVTVEDRRHLPYTNAVILELLRYTTIGSLGLPHETLCDTKLFDYEIPKGTYVIPNLWAVNHDPKAWPKPWKFNPERFLGSDGNLHPPGHPTRKGFMPFGAGTRVCLGESLAKSRLFLAIVCIIKRFEICKPLKGSLTSCDPRTYSFGGLLNPLPYKIRTVRRSVPVFVD